MENNTTKTNSILEENKTTIPNHIKIGSVDIFEPNENESKKITQERLLTEEQQLYLIGLPTELAEQIDWDEAFQLVEKEPAQWTPELKEKVRPLAGDEMLEAIVINDLFLDKEFMMGEEIIKYQCCICKGTVSSQQKSSHLDPCALFVLSNIDETRDNQKEQQFFCHFKCFRKLVTDESLHIIEDDFTTIGEIIQEDWSEKKDDEELLN